MNRILLITLLTVGNIVYSNFSRAQQTVTDSMLYEGMMRKYTLYVPAIYTSGQNVPLVFNLHGYGSNSAEQLAYGDFRSIADTAGFIIALPQGTKDGANVNYWNSGYGGAVNDLGFINSLIDEIAGSYSIDQNRIYSTGMSNGGFMSFTLACELSSRIVAVASVTGTMTPLQSGNCPVARPVPVMQIHGTADGTVSYNGMPGTMLSVDAVLNTWKTKNNCDANAIFTAIANTSTTDNCTAEKYEYKNGDDNSEVVHYKIINGGHTWPGSAYIVGVTNQDFNASVEIWKFFSRYKMDDFVAVDDLKNSEKRLKLISNNPVKSKLVFETERDGFEVAKIYDLSGKLVLAKSMKNQMIHSIDVTGFAPGMYFLKADGETSGYSFKFVVH